MHAYETSLLLLSPSTAIPASAAPQDGLEDSNTVSDGLLDGYNANVFSTDPLLIGVAILPNHPTTAVPALAVVASCHSPSF
jgi:hypothetical protein